MLLLTEKIMRNYLDFIKTLVAIIGIHELHRVIKGTLM